MKRIWIPQAVTSAMLLWALNPNNSYGYYILLRWVCCAAFAYLATQAFAHKKQGWAWVLGITAVAYNPIMRVHLTKEIWSVVNVVTIIVAVVSIFILKVDNVRKSRRTRGTQVTCSSWPLICHVRLHFFP